jgi:hypothetical protein
MKLIEDLGLRPVGTQGQKQRYGLYECPICHKHFEVATNNVRRGSSTKCKSCASRINNSDSKSEAGMAILHRFKQIHGDLYDYALVEYVDINTKVTIICSVHGAFTQLPNNHLKGQGCPECSGNRAKQAKVRDTIISSFMEVHGDTYDYSLVDYKNAKSKVTILCSVHGAFTKRASDHLHGSGCPTCHYESNSIASRMHIDTPTKLYYIHLPDYNLWKIGCTKNSIQTRFDSDKIRIEVIEVITFSTGAEAYMLESLILRELQHIKCRGVKILRGGNTELLAAPIDFQACLGDAYVSMLQTPTLRT